MSDVEEPPSKVTKFEMESQYLEGEVMEEGQEEWLSEGILTDDDYNPANGQDTSQDETNASLNDNSMENLEKTIDSQDNSQNSQETSLNNQENSLNNQDSMSNQESNSQSNQEIVNIQKTVTQLVENMGSENIEETLNNFENSKNTSQIDLPDDLDTFLIRKTAVKGLKKETDEPPADKDSDVDKSKQSDDDGNDTDDLLRMLGEGESKGKAQTVSVKSDQDSSDDDEYIFEGVRTLKVANAMRKYPAAKAVPEDDDVTDASSDEADTMKKMFGVKKHTANPKPTIKLKEVKNPTNPLVKTAVKVTSRPVHQKKVVRHVVRVEHKPVEKPSAPPRRPVHTPPIKTYTNKRLQPGTHMSLLKPAAGTFKVEHKPEIIEEKGFLENDNIDHEEEFTQQHTQAEKQENKQEQRIMKPEEMDEEIPTDFESDSDEESLYDELPSSDSEDQDDWFTLDIRAERAGDYLPLLGDKAYQLLTEEKHRVSERLATLRKSLSALTDSGKQQAERLRAATGTLAELDAA